MSPVFLPPLVSSFGARSSWLPDVGITLIPILILTTNLFCWSCVKSLVAQLRGVGVEMDDSKIANRILYGLGKEYESMRHALQARAPPLTVDVVTEHLLSWDASSPAIPSVAATPAVPTPTPPYWVAPVPAQNNLHRGPMATAMAMSSSGVCPSCPHCAQLSAAGPSRTPPSTSYRFSPYTTLSPRIICTACGKPGHHESRCWDRYPHLRPVWLRDPSLTAMHPAVFPLARPTTLPLPPPTVPRPSTHTAHIAVDSAPAVIPQSYSPVSPHAALPDPEVVFPVSDAAYNFTGPESHPHPPSDFAFPSLHEVLSNRLSFNNEYCFSLDNTPHLLSHRPSFSASNVFVDGTVYPDDMPGKWLVDSGASCHYSPFRHLFLSLHPVDPPVRILTGNGYIYAAFKGPIPLIIRAHNEIHHLHLDDVLFVPQLQSRVNLFSVVMLADKGIKSTFGPDLVTFTDPKGTVLATGSRIGNSWWLDADIRSHTLIRTHLCLDTQHSPTACPESVWHMRMGHLNQADLITLQRMCTGMSFGSSSIPAKTPSCVPCLVGKQHRNISRVPRSFPGRTRHSCLHIDICGPMQSYGYVAKHLYASVIVDEDTRFTYTYCLKSKDEIRDCVKEHIALVDRQTSDRVLAIFSDNEAALLQGGFQEWLRTCGIVHYTTQTYSPEMNGIAENAIKHVVCRASAMLSTAGIPVGFWPEAVRCATYLKNRSPHRGIGKTPFEAYRGTPPDISHVRIFGCRCYAHLEKDNRQKFDSHTIECVFMGYYATARLFAVFDVTRRVLMKKRDVVFFEHVLGHPTMLQYGLAPGYDIVGQPMPATVLDSIDTHDGDVPTPECLSQLTPAPISPVPAVTTPPVPAEMAPIISPPIDNPPNPILAPPTQLALFVSVNKPEVPSTFSDITTVPQAPDVTPPTSAPDFASDFNIRDMVRNHWSNVSFWRNTDRDSHDPTPLLNHFASVYEAWKSRLNISDPPDVSFATIKPDPTSWSSAMASPNKSWWLLAVYQEMCQLARMGTFEFVDIPPIGRKALLTKWVWKTKRLPDGNIERFKARWVARGDLQRKGIDYVETFAPVAMLVSLRILLTLVAILDLKLDQLDVVGAFLHGGLDTEVYLRQPIGFTLAGD